MAKDRIEDHLGSLSVEEAGAWHATSTRVGHLPNIAGIVAFAVPIERILTHSVDPLAADALVSLVVGVVGYLGGSAYGLRDSAGASTGPWAGTAAAAIAAVVLAALSGSGPVALVAVTTVLVLFAPWGSWSGFGREAAQGRRDAAAWLIAWVAMSNLRPVSAAPNRPATRPGDASRSPVRTEPSTPRSLPGVSCSIPT